MLCCQSVYSINSVEPIMSTISIPRVYTDCGQTLLHAIFEFSILTFTKCGRTEALVGLEYLGVIQWRVSMTIIASMDVGCTLLYGEIPPSLVTGNRAICVNISDIVISVGSFFFFFFSFLTKSLISASASPVCRSWHFQVFRQWQECLCRQKCYLNLHDRK